MKDAVGECLCLGDDCASDGAAEETKPGSVSDGPSSPLRAVDQAGPSSSPGEASWMVLQCRTRLTRGQQLVLLLRRSRLASRPGGKL